MDAGSETPGGMPWSALTAAVQTVPCAGSTTDRYHLAVATPYLTKSGVVRPSGRGWEVEDERSFPKIGMAFVEDLPTA